MADFNDLSGSRGPHEKPATSVSLLQRIRADDQAAWKDFVHIYFPLVYGWCRTAGLQEQDAADVVQEVFQAVAKSLERFQRNRPADSFHRWLRGVARHKIQDFWRRQVRQQVPIGGTTALNQMSQIAQRLNGDDSDRVKRSEIGVVAHRALELIRQEFEDRTWQAAWQVLVAGESPSEVAAALGITANAVYKAKARVIRRVREKLSDLFE